jgi:dipeptidyl aminopeptidase/acylaminoacyl peptidase
MGQRVSDKLGWTGGETASGCGQEPRALVKWRLVSKSPLTADDLSRFRWVDHVRLSPSGDRVAYQVTWADMEARQNLGRVLVGPAEPGAPARELRTDARRDHSPEWSPDGARIAFLSRRGPRDQLFAAPAGGGAGEAEAVQLTSIPDGVSSPAWSPDGRSIAFLARVFADPDAVVDDPRPVESDEQLRRPPVARVVSRLDYKRDGVGFLDGRHAHLFVVAAGGGEPRQLTMGAWSVGGFSWAPDGRSLAVVGDAEPGADLRRSQRLYAVDLDGGRRTLAGGLMMSTPAWSPRGDLVAVLAPTAEDGGRMERIWVVPAGGGEPRCLTADLDRSVGGSVISDMRGDHSVRLEWSPEGDGLHFLASGPGVAELLSVDLDGRVAVELAADRRAVADFDVEGDRIAAVVADASTPGEVVLVRGGAEHVLTDANPWLRERHVAEPARHVFTAADGLEIEGWLFEPPGFDPSRKHPLVMEIHGGPHGQYGWSFFHEFQMLAGMGFLVFIANPRGSDGYGEAFRRACVRDWGGADYRDLMTALDQLIARTGFVDEARMGVAGGSYGGFMTNWVVGHTDRFAAAVAMRSISNLVSEFAQHDIVLWGELEMGPRPWPDSDELWRRSPIRYVNDIHTPLLLLHGEMDLRCAVSQAEELFGALRLLGREVEMVRFPGESHDLSRSGRPDRRVERLRRIGTWFAGHLLVRTAERPAGAVAAGE